MGPSVSPPCGPLVGRERDGVLEFLGVPYAASTAGDGRFRPPRPAEPWTTPREAVKTGPVAWQGFSALEAMLGMGEREKSEDCLSLNIVTPAGPGVDALPVMVWIHGGSFLNGAGSLPYYRGRHLARRGVVVVTINYRLGALGALDLGPALGSEFASAASLATQDQVMALRWVRENIAHFGGDPGRVTVFGESAGGTAAGLLSAVAAADGLRHRVVAQSGPGFRMRTRDEAAEILDLVVSGVGASPEALLEVEPARIIAAQAAAASAISETQTREGRYPILAFQPGPDDEFLTEPPLGRIRSGLAEHVEVIIGSNAEEWKMFTAFDPAPQPDAAAMRRRAQKLFPDHDPDAARSAYERERGCASMAELRDQFEGDRVFTMPALELAEAHASAGHPTYVYRFSQRSTAMDGRLGACHGMEIPFVFGLVGAANVEGFVGEVGEDAAQLSALMAGSWAAFSRTGSPSHGEFEWRPFEGGTVMELGPEVGNRPGLYGATRPLWNRL